MCWENSRILQLDDFDEFHFIWKYKKNYRYIICYFFQLQFTQSRVESRELFVVLSEMDRLVGWLVDLIINITLTIIQQTIFSSSRINVEKKCQRMSKNHHREPFDLKHHLKYNTQVRSNRFACSSSMISHK